MWTTSTQSVIASIAFHPNDRILVIATINEVYFWDWSQPEPFIQTATNNPKEKVVYLPDIPSYLGLIIWVLGALCGF